MPPKKVSALAQAVKDRVTRKTAAKKPAAQKSAPKKTAAAKSPVVEPVVKKTAAKKPTANKSAAITADNNPAVAPKRALKSAGKAPIRRTSSNKKRKASDDEDEEDDDEKENEAPPAKKAKTNKNTTARASAPPVSKAAAKMKTAAKKSAAKKTAAGKATASKATVAEADVITKAMTDVISNARGKKRKAAEEGQSESEEDEVEAGDDEAPRAKKVKVNKVGNAAEKKAAPKKTAPKKAVAPKKAPKPVPKVKVGAQINFAPTQPLDIFVFGEGSAGELGLGSRRTDGKMPIDVKRPRFNPNLSGENPGVVQFACGGMHGIALTKDNKVLTWGVNDNGALGRDTTWNGGLRRASLQGNWDDNDENENNEEEDISSDDGEDDEDDSGLNPRESTPAEIDMTNVAPGTKFVQVAATDSASFALTEDGRIYSWGTFRVSRPPCPNHNNHSHSPFFSPSFCVLIIFFAPSTRPPKAFSASTKTSGSNSPRCCSPSPRRSSP